MPDHLTDAAPVLHSLSGVLRLSYADDFTDIERDLLREYVVVIRQEHDALVREVKRLRAAYIECFPRDIYADAPPFLRCRICGQQAGGADPADIEHDADCALGGSDD